MGAYDEMTLSGSGFAEEKKALESLKVSIEKELETIYNTLSNLSSSWQDKDSENVLSDAKDNVSKLQSNIENVITEYKSQLDAVSASANDIYTFGA